MKVKLEIMKDNKLIAEFMGLDSFKDSLASLHQGKINVDVDVYEQAQYHSSWDWLRPVMVKIDTYANSDSLSIAEYEEYRNKYFLIAEGSIYDDILDTHKQVVQFIKSIQLPF